MRQSSLACPRRPRHPYAGDIKPFLYGSHYSNAGFVTFYLLRLEPFTSLHIELQGGHFDCPDRLFFSAGECWKGVTSSMTDVKVRAAAASAAPACSAAPFPLFSSLLACHRRHPASHCLVAGACPRVVHAAGDVPQFQPAAAGQDAGGGLGLRGRRPPAAVGRHRPRVRVDEPGGAGERVCLAAPPRVGQPHLRLQAARYVPVAAASGLELAGAAAFSCPAVHASVVLSLFFDLQARRRSAPTIYSTISRTRAKSASTRSRIPC